MQEAAMQKQTKGTKGKRRISFSFLAPRAREVSLVADFNNWQPGNHPMKKGRHGEWTRTVFLLPGTYEYKFYVDGVWRADERNSKWRKNKYGTRNSLLKVNPH
jgi:1,4-alpha-glucan branching enzyme